MTHPSFFSHLLSAFWQLHYITSQKHTVTGYKTRRYGHTTRWQHFARLNLWRSSPSYQLATVCLFSLPPRTHLNRSCTKAEMERLRVVMSVVREKPPCWSYRQAPSSTWFIMNCGPPSASILSISWAFLLGLHNIGKYWHCDIFYFCKIYCLYCNSNFHHFGEVSPLLTKQIYPPNSTTVCSATPPLLVMQLWH